MRGLMRGILFPDSNIIFDAQNEEAALRKNQDNIVDASGTVTEACSACHDVYREKTNLADRCTP
jgi:cytochrome c556